MGFPGLMHKESELDRADSRFRRFAPPLPGIFLKESLYFVRGAFTPADHLGHVL